MFKFFMEKDLISPNQSGFKPGYSCINQRLSITHDIHKSFDCGYGVRSVSLDKMAYLENYITRDQRVVLNGQVSLRANVKTGVPQG